MKKEYRNIKIGKIRSTTEEGVVEAYLTAWDTIDSYRSTFLRGCFKRTFNERGHKIRLIWNHERLAGKVLECREDDYGPFVKVQFNLDTQIGREAFAHVRAEDVDAFSFGFNVVKDHVRNGIREFEEIKVLECGPVVFEANGAAKVVDVRAEDFDETFAKNELYNRGWKLIDALDVTISDIYWNSELTPEEVKSKVDEAISKFHGRYMEWLDEWYAQFEERTADTKQLIREGNLIEEAIKRIENIATITEETSLTRSDMDLLKAGKLLPIEHRSKLTELPEDIQKAHRQTRIRTVENLCSELREQGFTEAEKARFTALLHSRNGEETSPDAFDQYRSMLDDLKTSLKL